MDLLFYLSFSRMFQPVGEQVIESELFHPQTKLDNDNLAFSESLLILFNLVRC